MSDSPPWTIAKSHVRGIQLLTPPDEILIATDFNEDQLKALMVGEPEKFKEVIKEEVLEGKVIDEIKTLVNIETMYVRLPRTYRIVIYGSRKEL